VKRDLLTPDALDARSIRVEILRLEREHRHAIEAIAQLHGCRTFASADPTHLDRVRAAEDSARHVLRRDRAASQVAALLEQLAAMRPAGVITAATWSIPALGSSSRWAGCAPASAVAFRVGRPLGETPVSDGTACCFPALRSNQGALPFIDVSAFMPRPGAHEGPSPAGHHTTEKPWTSP
jgi:hypothetical protein